MTTQSSLPETYTTSEYDNAQLEIQVAKSRIDEIKVEIKRIYAEGHTRGCSTLEREKKSLDGTIKNAESVIANNPPKYSATFLKSRIVRHFEVMLKRATSNQERFIDNITRDPLYEIEWHTDTFVKAKVEAEVATYVLGLADEKFRLVDFLEALDEYKKHAINHNVLRAARTSHSTNPIDNAIEQFKLAAWAEMFRDSFDGFGGSELYPAKYYVEENKVIFDEVTPVMIRRYLDRNGWKLMDADDSQVYFIAKDWTKESVLADPDVQIVEVPMPRKYQTS